MSCLSKLQAKAITEELREQNLPGIVDICPGNASYMIRFEPEEIHPDELIEKLKKLEEEVSWEEMEIHSRIVDVPIFFRSEEHTSELQSRFDLVCRLLLEKKK